MNSEIVTLAQAIASSETQGRLAGARGNKSDKEMKRHRFTSKAEKAPFSALLVNPRRFISFFIENAALRSLSFRTAWAITPKLLEAWLAPTIVNYH